ncbi:MAG: zinc ribbon domain-containing protein [Candidatus Electrothrix sp. ATG1]|nr:zinc ribbon domain-containing protein [Candidatus Electrothrix sp. ATG1]MCI5207664.1 zinc ribbon domain-containing protein [Candidatus Electrothrix sp. ATG2]
MPVYEYECPACEKVFEVHQGMNDSPLTSCSVCGGEVKKIMSMSSFHLKGGGWYSDGYASGSSTQKSADDKKVTEKSVSSSADSAKKTPSCGTGSACKGCSASS